MKKKLVLIVVVAVGALMAQPPGGPRGRMGFGPGPGPMGPGGLGMGRIVTGAPFSAVEVITEQQALAGGNTIQRQSQTTIHRDSQGRTRMETEIVRPDGASGQTTTRRITISDPVAGVVHQVDPQSKTVNSMQTRPGPGRGPNGMRPAPNSMAPRNPNGPGGRNPNATRPVDPNVQTEALGTQIVNGVSATGSRTTRTIPAGTIGNAQAIQIVHETWMSEDLKVPVMVKTSDPRSGTMIRQLTNINRVEPDASLFQVPSDYTVRRGGPANGRGPGGPGRPGRQNN